MRNSLPLERDRNHMSNKQPIGCLDINNSKFVHTNNLFKIEIISITIDILIKTAMKISDQTLSDQKLSD